MSKGSDKHERDSTPRQKPTLADQHWRATLRSRKRSDLEADMEAAIEGGDDWRFGMLLQAGGGWGREERFLNKAIAAKRDDMFFAMTTAEPGWQNDVRLTYLGEEAAKNGRTAIIRHLVEDHGMDAHTYSEEMLRHAVSNNHAGTVAYLISKEADVNVWNGAPLKDAAEGGYLDIVTLLVAAGAEVDVSDGEPLRNAAREGHGAVVEYLLEKGADPKADNFAAFAGAAREGHKHIVDIFLARGLDPNANDGAALTEALQYKKFDVANLLISHGADINASQGLALRNAARAGDFDTAQFLLDRKAKLNLVSHRATPLTEAVRSGKPAMIEMLMQAGADDSALQFEAWRVARQERSRPLMHALINGRKEALNRQRAGKADEFKAVFGTDYTMDDLRRRKGPSGDTGLLIAAATRRFAEFVGKAKGGRLTGDDLYHPDDRIDTVLSSLLRHKNLQDFFKPAFWADRLNEVQEVHAQLPAAYQKRVSLAAISTEVNYRNLRKKGPGLGGNGYKPG